MLDTNICIYVINKKPSVVVERFKQEAPGSIVLSSISAAELTYGVSKSGSERNKEALAMFLAPFTLLPFDDSVIWQYGQLRAQLEKQGAPIGPMDTMIAAHALSKGLTLVTNNLREFERVPKLHLENWALAA